MNLLQELLALAEGPEELQVNKKKVDYRKEQEQAYARSKWHKTQADKYKGKDDPESELALKAHTEAQTDWLFISQEYLHKNPNIAQKQIDRAEEKLSKSKLAQQDVANKG